MGFIYVANGRKELLHEVEQQTFCVTPIAALRKNNTIALSTVTMG